MTTPSVLAAVLTMNEAEHLGDCLASLHGVAAEIMVLDSGSTDATLDIAHAAGARTVHRPFDGFANQRNAALDLAGNADWVLFLDADERLTTPGAREIRAALASATSDIAAFWIPRRNQCFGRELRGGGWWPDHQARLLRPARVRYDAARQVHETPVINGASARLLVPLIHLNYATRREFVGKQAAYTRLRVEQALATRAIPRRRACLSAPARELWRRLVTLQGYRDGLIGVFMAGVLAGEEARACWAIRREAGR